MTTTYVTTYRKRTAAWCKVCRIGTRTDRTRAEVRLLAHAKHWGIFGANVVMTANAIAYGLRTGRLKLAAEQMVDGLSGYQYTRLVIRMAASESITTTQDVIRYLNGVDSMTATLPPLVSIV